MEMQGWLQPTSVLVKTECGNYRHGREQKRFSHLLWEFGYLRDLYVAVINVRIAFLACDCFSLQLFLGKPDV